jgi:hypothetical protein
MNRLTALLSTFVVVGRDILKYCLKMHGSRIGIPLAPPSKLQPLTTTRSSSQRFTSIRPETLENREAPISID